MACPPKNASLLHVISRGSVVEQWEDKRNGLMHYQMTTNWACVLVRHMCLLTPFTSGEFFIPHLDLTCSCQCPVFASFFSRTSTLRRLTTNLSILGPCAVQETSPYSLTLAQGHGPRSHLTLDPCAVQETSIYLFSHLGSRARPPLTSDFRSLCRPRDINLLILSPWLKGTAPAHI